MTRNTRTTDVNQAIKLLKANGFIDVTESAKKFYEKFAEVPRQAKIVLSDPSGIGYHYCHSNQDVLELADELLWPHQMPVLLVTYGGKNDPACLQ